MELWIKITQVVLLVNLKQYLLWTMHTCPLYNSQYFHDLQSQLSFLLRPLFESYQTIPQISNKIHNTSYTIIWKSFSSPQLPSTYTKMLLLKSELLTFIRKYYFGPQVTQKPNICLLAGWKISQAILIVHGRYTQTVNRRIKSMFKVTSDYDGTDTVLQMAFRAVLSLGWSGDYRLSEFP